MVSLDLPGTLSKGVGFVKVKTRKVLLIALAVWIAIPAIFLSPIFVKTYLQTQRLKHTFDEYADSLVSQHFDRAYELCGGPSIMPSPMISLSESTNLCRTSMAL